MVEEFRIVQTDVLVVGAGGAGIRAAIEAARNKVNVILAEKGFIGKIGATVTANARAVSRQRETTAQELELRFRRIVMTGCYLNDQNLVWIAVKEGPENVAELSKFAEEYNAGPNESYNNALSHELSKYPNASVMENTIITKLLTQGGKIVGATGLDIVNGEFILFKAKAVTLATGGYGELFQPSQLNPLAIRGGIFGDGCALAYHAEADLTEMEFLQFQELPDNPKWLKWTRHVFGPSRFRSLIMGGPYYDKDGKPIPSLSVEAIAKLPVGCGPPYGLAYNPDVDRLVYEEMMKGPVYVDMIELLEKEIKAGMYKDLTLVPLTAADKLVKLDPTKFPNKVRIVLGPLIGQGGPRINEKCETNVPGLYAAGEVAGNVYGAYRMVGIMDTILTFGRRAGKYAGEYVKTVKQGDIDLEEVAKERDRIYGFLKPKLNSISPLELKKKIWNVTGIYFNVLKDEKGLKGGLKEIEELKNKDLPRMQAVNIRVYNLELIDAVEAAFMLDVAEMYARAALFRTESRCCHVRKDFPDIDNKNWLVHTVLRKERGEMKFSKAPVIMTTIKPPAHRGEDAIPV